MSDGEHRRGAPVSHERQALSRPAAACRTMAAGLLVLALGGAIRVLGSPLSTGGVLDIMGWFTTGVGLVTFAVGAVKLVRGLQRSAPQGMSDGEGR